jgi:uncharacterized protein (TIGR04255 family)
MAELPVPLLAHIDPNIRYAPAIRIHWGNFIILSGNQSAGLACKLPYPGWTAGFKPSILKLAQLIGEAAIVDVVERFSLKYTNIVPSELGVAPVVVDFALKIGALAACDFPILSATRRRTRQRLHCCSGRPP